MNFGGNLVKCVEKRVCVCIYIYMRWEKVAMFFLKSGLFLQIGNEHVPYSWHFFVTFLGRLSDPLEG